MPMLYKNTTGECKVVNKYQSKYTVYIGRGSKWGNPYTHLTSNTKAKYVVASRQDSIEAFARDLGNDIVLLRAVRKELQGQVLGCFCKPKSCHGDVLAKVANMTDNEFKDFIKDLL